MMEPIQNQSRNRFQNRARTRWGTTDQIQIQIQTVVKAVCVVFGEGFHPRSGDLGLGQATTDGGSAAIDGGI